MLIRIYFIGPLTRLLVWIEYLHSPLCSSNPLTFSLYLKDCITMYNLHRRLDYDSMHSFYSWKFSLCFNSVLIFNFNLKIGLRHDEVILSGSITLMKNIWLFTAHIKNQLDIDKKRLNLFSHFLIISDYLSWATDFFHLLQSNKRIINILLTKCEILIVNYVLYSNWLF